MRSDAAGVCRSATRENQTGARDASSTASALDRRQMVFLATLAFGVFLVTTAVYPLRRPDYFLIADALLHGHLWVDPSLLPTHVDVIDWQGHTYLPFSIGPTFLVLPLVAIFGPMPMNGWQVVINPLIATADIALLLLLIRRAEPRARRKDVSWLVILLAFSTPIWWITVRTGPWHFAQLMALGATTIAVMETIGRRRAWLVGLSYGFAILCRLALVVGIPLLAAYLFVQARREGNRSAIQSTAVFIAFQALALMVTGLYNGLRFGSPIETGYALATLPPFLMDLRAQGLFSIRHLPMNLELLFLHRPITAPPPFFVRPDGHGLSLVLAAPALALVAMADFARPLVRWAAVTAVVVLIPSLVYYGGGWIQLGFRYMLDALPFIVVLLASAVRRPMGGWWKALILFGAAVNLWGIVWSYTGLLEK